MKNYFEILRDAKPEFKKITILILITYFFVLFSYPLVRSATSAVFYEAYTSADYSFATFVGVIALMVIIFINNKLQAKIGVHKLYLWTGIATVVTLLGAFLLFLNGFKEMAFVLFATKEAYIVLLVHTCLAFANAYYSTDQIKQLIGPIGAMGSIGGIVGGQVTSVLAKSVGTNFVFYLSLVTILITVAIFYLTRHTKIKGLEPNKSITPIKAVRGVKKYVFLIAAIVSISQFVIFVADLQFNIVFEQIVQEKNARTAYLGDFYSIINGVSLVLQFVVLPILLQRFKTQSIFIAIPLLYLVLIICGLSIGIGTLVMVAGVFIMMKGTDYSVFAAVKEVMYSPLLSLQKFGAKYITDMFVYRSAKALIAFVMAQLMIKDTSTLAMIQFICLSLWIFCIFILFKEQERLKH